jgi:hypothetical protein
MKFLFALLAGVGMVAGSACQNDVPLFPTYETDVKPLMEAHCIRCHGGGGSFHGDPYSTLGVVTDGDFTRLDDNGSRHGLLYYTRGNVARLRAYVDQIGMPPPPAQRLGAWEHELLFRWADDPPEGRNDAGSE